MALKSVYGMNKDEDSRTRPGEKDYTGHMGDKSKTRSGDEDYEAHEGSQSKTHEGEDYEGEPKTKEDLADHLAVEARDGAHLLELLEEAGWSLTPPGEEGLEVEGEETLAIGGPLGMSMGGGPLDIVSARFRAAENAVKGKGRGRG